MSEISNNISEFKSFHTLTYGDPYSHICYLLLHFKTFPIFTSFSYLSFSVKLFYSIQLPLCLSLSSLLLSLTFTATSGSESKRLIHTRASLNVFSLEFHGEFGLKFCLIYISKSLPQSGSCI